MHGGLAPADAVHRLVRLAGEMVTGAPPDPLVAAAAAAGPARAEAGGVVQVSSVARDLGISERQLHRRCVAAVGYGPVLLRRVLRFRQFVSRIDAGAAGGDLGVLAAEAGYADQAHLTRESRDLAGLPPAALARLRRAPALTPARLYPITNGPADPARRWAGLVRISRQRARIPGQTRTP